ncbi:5-deoxy-glucuronate isomerase [Actinophytocola xinjiangensis]|uniref:5-deoxy-glucuronate isomerase n=1 Tax=Actinophytocola xinjiangensis TaxID=485602 RepID=A0A7Z0WKX6_9PSEU|nr:5-deoxy-glucuronate isomerase [Actinophytocola xinjiangensis]OLF08678.1 5-deoxy-glucuronate isomerase [Actinophytocola xinjiangensis]
MRHHLPAGSTGPDRVQVTPASAGWTYSGLTVLDLAPDQPRTVHTGESETLVLPLAGGCVVTVEDQVMELTGRPNVFAGPSDFAYLPRDATATLTATAPATLALPAAVCSTRRPPRYAPAAGVPVELRGAGRCSRQVNNFCTPDAFDAEKLIACEVLTPGGNWSSYPPHKHDEDRPGESVLEEIYYFQVAPGPTGPGLGYQRVYASAAGGIDVLAEVRTDDVVLIPHGWHGPSIAVPGYDLYYLNVMAGPGAERAWLISDDPAHTWIRDTWADEPTDPRLPFQSRK